MHAMSVSDACLRTCLLAALAAALAACGAEGGDAATEATPMAAMAAAPTGTAPMSSLAAKTASVADTAAFGERQLDHPDDLQMLMLAYRLEGRQPPIAEWAAAQSRVVHANEFERSALLEAERQRLQGIYDGTADVGRLRLNVRARFGEYDATRAGYYLDAFMPGSVFHFNARPVPHPIVQERVDLQVDNSEEINFWPLDAAAAQDALQRTGGMRNVTLDSRFRITGISRRGDGAVLSARLLGYTIGSDRHGRPVTLGERRFDVSGQGGR